MTTPPEVDWESYRSSVPIGEEPKRDSKLWYMREDIILAHLYLVKSVASDMYKNMPNYVDKDDLESWAALALMKAVDRYNHRLGVPFQAFCIRTLKFAIRDGVRQQDWAPRSLRREQRDIDKAEETLRQHLGRTPSALEVADFLGIELKQIAHTKFKSDIAMHTSIEGSIEALNKSVETTDEDRLVEATRRAVVAALAHLTPRQAAIVALHYYEGRPLKAIAPLLGINSVKCGDEHTAAVLVIWQQISAALSD